MQQVIRQIILLAAVTFCVVPCSGIKIRGGSSSYTYDPSDPITLTLICADENGNIEDAQWLKNGEFIEATGRLTLNEGTIGTEDPQRFEGNYSCHNGQDTSKPVSFYVVPRRNTEILTKKTPLEGIDATFDCPLHFGSLREKWTVFWTVEDKNRIGINIDGEELYTRDNPEYQLVIRNASINYDGARFKCQAHRDGGYAEDSHFVTIQLFHEVEATTKPKEIVVINGITGEVTYEFKAYPRPNIKLCYNGTCGSHGTYGRMQVSTIHSQDDTTHTARLTVHEMREEDNGNVTINVTQPESNFTDQVMLFLLYEIEVRMEDKATGREVPLHIVLRRPVYFDFEIEFVDKDDVSLGTIDGEKGVLVFSCTITVNSDTEVRGRFKIGDKVGPYSEPVAVDVETPDDNNSEQNGQQHTVTIVSVISVTVLLLVFIICTTIIIVIIVMCKLRKNKRSTGGRDAEDGTGEGNTQPEGESEVQLQNNGPQTISLNHGHQPQIAVIAATPHDMNGGLVQGVYPYGPYFPRPHFGSASSDHSSAPSRKSSAGYESGTGSGIYPYTFSPCATHHYSRGACNYEVDAYHCCHQQHNLPQQQQLDHNRQMVNSQELSTTNLNAAARPPMRRNLSDPNISRHKQPASRPLEEQRNNKLLSSSSVV